MHHPMHVADQSFVAALEDFASSIQLFSDTSLFALDSLPDSDLSDESTLLFDTNLSTDDAEDMFAGASDFSDRD